ncbi:MAG: DUF294 nucleotidyltransferase-like domain-containing protein, partial [Myxococcota bacterium]|nr:DUF294 nucleotidyltransferase-like domain-containing protein [Myxococcota bacterium]
MNWKSYGLGIVLPSVSIMVLFVGLILGILLPTFEQALVERKREMIRELTHSAVSVLKEYEAERAAGHMSLEEAQAAAVARLRDLRYGPEGKDYFWITDMQPRMIMHPFREELNGQDLSDFVDPEGNRVFVEFVRRVEQSGSGYVNYVWQWKDDPARLATKESFVMSFEPWGWVVGTGIYVEDVRVEIDALSSRMLGVSSLIALFIAAMLSFAAWHSFRFEKQRGEAQRALQETAERYRALVEASKEGTMMVVDGRCAYSNPTMAAMLGYEPQELSSMALESLAADEASAGLLSSLAEGEQTVSSREGLLRRKDGTGIDVLLGVTAFEMGERRGHILVARDISLSKRTEAELGESRERYKALRETIELAVWRSSAQRDERLLEANQAARQIFGIDMDAMPTQPFLDLAFGAEEADWIRTTLQRDGFFKSRVFTISRSDGEQRVLRCSAVLVRDEDGKLRYYDGIARDISLEQRLEAERASLLEDLQASIRFLDEPVSVRSVEPVWCGMHSSIREAAQLMGQARSGDILVSGAEGEALGVVSDRDLRSRVLAQGVDSSRPIYTVMSSPVPSLPASSLTWEALQFMQSSGLTQVFLMDADGRVSAALRAADVLSFHRHSSALLLREIGRAETVPEMAQMVKRLPVMVNAMCDGGVRPKAVGRAVSAVADALVARLVTLYLEREGPAPRRFAFLALGSQGREEQTLYTDQDNAIIYAEAAAEAEQDEQVRAYFLAMGSFVCEALASIGYMKCPGGTMASEASCNRSLSEWKSLFRRWIRNSTPQDLLSVNVFFDFRSVAGDAELASELNASIRGEMSEYKPFFVHFA